MSDSERRPPRDSGLSYVPAGWLGFVILFTLYGLGQSWPLLGVSGLSAQVAIFVYAGLAFGVVSVLWGLYVFSLAFTRFDLFRRRFVVWQWTVIAWVLLRQAYALAVPEFTLSARSLAVSAVEIAVGLLCIHLLRSGAGLVESGPGQVKRSPAFTVVAALLGLILGAAAGFGVGLGVGLVLSELMNVSCFEGGCGYFVFFIALVGVPFGAVIGLVLALWLVRRRPRTAA